MCGLLDDRDNTYGIGVSSGYSVCPAQPMSAGLRNGDSDIVSGPASLGKWSTCPIQATRSGFQNVDVVDIASGAAVLPLRP